MLKRKNVMWLVKNDTHKLTSQQVNEEPKEKLKQIKNIKLPPLGS